MNWNISKWTRPYLPRSRCWLSLSILCHAGRHGGLRPSFHHACWCIELKGATYIAPSALFLWTLSKFSFKNHTPFTWQPSLSWQLPAGFSLAWSLTSWCLFFQNCDTAFCGLPFGAVNFSVILSHSSGKRLCLHLSLFSGLNVPISHKVSLVPLIFSI